MYRITDDRQQQCLGKNFLRKEKTIGIPISFGCKFAAYMYVFLWHYRLAVSLSGRVGVHS